MLRKYVSYYKTCLERGDDPEQFSGEPTLTRSGGIFLSNIKEEKLRIMTEIRGITSVLGGDNPMYVTVLF